MKIKLMLYELAHNKGVSLREVSRGTGISTNTLSGINTDQATMIRLSAISTLCEYFGCQPGDLLKLVNK